MAKSMRNAIREAAKVDSENKLLIANCIKEGITTRRSIAESTGLGKNVVSNLLSNDKELREQWIIKKRMMVDTAVDNIEDIINDPKHKDNFQASKWVASNVDSELSHILFPQMGDLSLTIPSSGDDGGDPVVIKFTGGNKTD
jgi:hypothetical protein